MSLPMQYGSSSSSSSGRHASRSTVSGGCGPIDRGSETLSPSSRSEPPLGDWEITDHLGWRSATATTLPNSNPASRTVCAASSQSSPSTSGTRTCSPAASVGEAWTPMDPPTFTPGDSPAPAVPAPEAQPASNMAEATATDSMRRIAPGRGGTSIAPLYVGLMVERLPFLSDRYETATVTLSMYTALLGCCGAEPGLEPNTGIVAIRLTTPSPFTT